MSLPPRHLSDEEFQAALQQLDSLVQEFEKLPFPEVQAKVFAMLQVIDAVHREGVGRLVTWLRQQEPADWLEQATVDPAVRALLLFYDLAPAGLLPAEQPIVAPPAAANGAAPGPPSPLIALDKIQLLQPAAPRPVQKLSAPRFEPVARRAELPPGAMLSIAIDDIRLLLVNVAGAIYAVGDVCPGSDMPLSFGALEGDRIICGWHQEVYDVRSGRCLDPAGRADNPRLPVYPVSIEGEEIRIARRPAPAASPAGERQAG